MRYTSSRGELTYVWKTGRLLKKNTDNVFKTNVWLVNWFTWIRWVWLMIKINITKTLNISSIYVLPASTHKWTRAGNRQCRQYGGLQNYVNEDLFILPWLDWVEAEKWSFSDRKMKQIFTPTVISEISTWRCPCGALQYPRECLGISFWLL